MPEQEPTLEAVIADLEVADGSVACVWLGQASYLFKSPAGQIVMIDPYLTDWAEEQWGLRRVIPPVIDPGTIEPDLLLISHWHEDHLDAPLVKQWARAGVRGTFAGPVTCTVRARAWGWPPDQVVDLPRGSSYQQGDVRVRATFARHETPEAPAGDEVGFLLDIGGVRVWYVGDTEYDARLRPMREDGVDVALVPINGVGGNLNAEEAALLMRMVAPRVAVPMHYNMWRPEAFGPGATLDPRAFVDAVRQFGSTAEVRILEVGAVTTFARGSG